MDQNQIWPQSVHSYHTYMFQILLQCVLCCWDKDRKLNFPIFFLSSRGITLSKLIEPEPNSNLTCIFINYIHIYKFELNVSNGCGDNDRKVNDEGIQKDRRTEWRNGITLYAPVIWWRGHDMFKSLFLKKCNASSNYSILQCIYILIYSYPHIKVKATFYSYV